MQFFSLFSCIFHNLIVPLQPIISPMRIRLHNARILTMSPKDDNIFMGEIVVEDGRIIAIGTDSITGQYDKEIDCHANLLMPGFKNAHAHSGMSGLRSLADDLPLNEWLTKSIFPVEALMTADDIYWMSQLSVLEYLTSGITACFDMYMEQEAVAKAMDDMGFRCVQTSGANDFSKDIREMSRLYDNINQPDSLQSYILGFHAEYTTNIDNLKAIAAQIDEKKSPCYVHACETQQEVEGCLQRYGMTPVKFLDSLGMFKYGGGIYHGVHMSEEDFDVMKKRGLFVVTNPGSNTKLASGIAPIKKYMELGIPIAIGTDGPASNNCLDFFREMFLVTGLAKLRENDAAVIDAKDVLKMATVNGAKAMHLKDCETLSVGQKADIIMIDLQQPNMQPINNIEKNIVYSGSKQNVKMTMIEGKILYWEGKFLNTDAQNIYQQVERVKTRLCKEVNG